MASVHTEDSGSGFALRIAFYGGLLVCLVDLPSATVIPATALAGLFLILLGLALRIWAQESLGALWSTRVRLRDDHFLTQQGPYRFLRHPGYLALALLYLGVAVAFNSLNALLIFVLGLAPALAHRMALEEAVLAERFGQQYQQYAAHTKRLVPFLF